MFLSAGPQAAEPLLQAGCQIVRGPRAGPLVEDELIASLRGVCAVIASSDPYTERVLGACPDLRVIARTGVGYDAIDVPAATRRGIAVVTTPGRIAETVADFTFALLLALARRLPEAAALMGAGGWAAGLPGTDVWGRCLGVVGMGAIGGAVARRARGFGMRVLGYDPHLPEAAIAGRGAEPTALDTLLAESDFVTLHAALTPESRGLIGAEALSRMRPTAILVNAARGELIDTGALLEALRAGRIGGAALDAFDQEPLPPGHPLRQAPRCLLTPHIAADTRENTLDMARRAAAAAVAVLAGRRPPPDARVLNPEVLGGLPD